MIESTETQTEAQEIADAVETALEKQHVAQSVMTDAEAQAKAQALYAAWRNKNLQTLAPDAFRQVESASGALIAAIAAELIL